MCCLRFEHEFYREAQKRLPAVGAIIPLEEGRGKVVDVNVITNMLTVQTEDEGVVHIHGSQLSLQGLCRRHGIGCNMKEKNCQALLTNGDADAAVADSNGDAEDDFNGLGNDSGNRAGDPQ